MKKNRVLIVEDEGVLSMDMANTLEAMGYEVVDAVPSGEEAIQLIDKEVPDLILMDVQLSGEIDGIQTAEKINKKYNIPIIYISGHTDELTLSRAKITGPYGYLKKSFNFSELNTTIDMAIYKNEMQRKVVENENLLNATLESIEVAVINVDRDGYIKYSNESAEKMLSISKKQSKMSQIDRIGHKWIDDKGEELVHPYKKKSRKRIEKAEYKLLNTASGKSVPVECSINILPAGYVYLIRNIEEKKQRDRFQSELASIVESSQDAIIGIDTNGIIKSWNNGAKQILGYDFNDVNGQNISMLTPPNYPNELPDKIERLKKGEIAGHYEGVRQRKDGEEIAMSILPSPIRNSAGDITGISFIARDVTEKKNLEKEVIEIGEKERERIGQDLHDSLGQQLTGVLLNMKTLENMIKEKISYEELEQMKNTEEMTKTAIMHTRTLARNLIPVKLQTEGLPYALEDLANFARTVYKMKAETFISGEFDDVSDIVETQLYHIAQEAVNNAVKHSGGDMITISLNTVKSELVLSVKDNGKGLKKSRSEGIGVKIMQYRANLINGSLFMLSEDHEGTIILCRVPVPGAEKEKQI